MIAGGDACDSTTDRLDHTGSLVARHQRQRREGRELRSPRHHVGMAHADSRDPHEDLARRRTGEIERFDRIRRVARAKHRGANLQRLTPAGTM